MKKITALFLTLVMLVSLFPLGITAQADQVTTKPFYMVNWDQPEGDVKYIYGMPGSWTNGGKIDPTKTNADSVSVLIGGYGSDIKTAAENMKASFDKRPAGTRFFNFAAQRTLLISTAKDLIDVRHGIELTKNWVDAFCKEYKSIGGQLDGILLDLEYIEASAYYINANYYSNSKKPNKEIYNQIANNEFYKTVLRPELVKRGFIFYDNPNPSKYPYRSELWTLETCSEDGGNGTSQSIWGQLIGELWSGAMTASVYEPLIKYYPDAIVSDYTTGDSYAWNKSMGHTGSQAGYNGTKAGNASNDNFYDYATGYLFYGYSSESNRTKRTKYQKPASYNDAYFADAPFSRTNWEINGFKNMLQATDTGKVNAWITYFNYGTYGPGYSRTPYYSELIYHIGMANPEPFIGYILESEVIARGYDDPDPNVCEYDYNLKVVDELLSELTRVAGTSDRKAIVTPLTWNENFFISGMYAGGRNIWRLTPNTEEVSKADFKVKDKAPTFTVNGVTITFPQGRIIEDSPITHVGTCGYWIETPSNVAPVITSTADRYQNDPSFQDTFDNYETGAFTANSVLPDTFWSISGSAEIQANGKGNVLAMSGNASVTNTKIVQLITAGDYYAKQQAWEVAVTLPSGNYGDVKVLSAGGTDGGVKISGGKVYYDNAGTYQELSGVSLAAGTYTVKREVDFRTDGAYKCTYSIYDATGNRLGGADNVAMAIAAIPVTTLSLSTTGASNAVLFDNYKLYPTGVTASLDLYDAELGRKLANPEAASTEDVGYRLSWMNASNQYKVARIYDAKTGKVIKTVQMAPGMDGITTGIADAGTSGIIVAVEVQDGTAPTRPNYDNGDFKWNAVGYSLGMAGGTPDGNYSNSGNSGGSNNGGSNNGGNTGDGGNNDGVIDFDNIGAETNPADPTVGGNINNTPNDNNNATPDPEPGVKKGLSGGVIALIVIGSLIVLLGILTAVFLLVIKPKLTAASPAWLLKLAGREDLLQAENPEDPDLSATRKIDIPEDEM